MNKITTEKLLKVKQSTTKTIRSVIEFDKKLTSKSAKLTKFLWKKLQQYCTLLIPADKHDDGHSIVSRSRLIVFGVICVIFVLMCRLLLITTKDIYTHKQYLFNKKKPFSRLEIVDRNGQVLANNIIVYDLYLEPSRMTSIEENLTKITNIIPNAISNRK